MTDWSDAQRVPQTFTVSLTGRRDATAELFLLSDPGNLYFAITLSEPPPQQNVLTIQLGRGDARRTITITGGGTSPTVTDDGANRATVAVGGGNGSTTKRVYEGRIPVPLVSSGTGDFGIRLTFNPGGNAPNTNWPGADTFLRLSSGTVAGGLVANANGPYPAIGQFAYSRFDTIQFSSSGSSTGPGITYHWDFGDGSTSTDPNPRHTYRRSGNFKPKLTVSDGSGSVWVFTEVTITPNVRVRVLNADQQAGARCSGMTVTARNKNIDATVDGRTDFHAVLSDASCFAEFDLTPNETYVFSVRNTLTDRFDTWPNPVLRPDETDDNLPARLATICVEPLPGGTCNASTSKVLTPATYDEARERATPLARPRPNLEIQYRLTGRTIPCSVQGAGDILVHAQLPLPALFQRPGFAPPALGLYIDRARADGGCELKSIPEGELTVVEAIDQNGATSTGVIGSTGNALTPLFPDPDLYRVARIVDELEDNGKGKDDLFLTFWGVLPTPSRGPSDTLYVEMLANSIQFPEGTAQVTFHFTTQGIRAPGTSALPDSFDVRVICNKVSGQCNLPPGQNNAIVLENVTVSGAPVENGTTRIILKMNIRGIQTVGMRIVAGTSSGLDYSPDLGQAAAKFTWPGDSNSFRVAF